VDFRHLCTEEVASVVASMGTDLMGYGSECCLVSRKSGLTRTNVVGEKRMEVVFCFWLLLLRENRVSVKDPMCHSCGQ
jgi:hypothetical protein